MSTNFGTSSFRGAFRKHLLATAAGFALVAVPALAREPDQPGVKIGHAAYSRYLVPAEKVEAIGAQQYGDLIKEARYKGAVLADDNAQLRRVRKIAESLLPAATRFNERAKEWKWEVNVIRSPTVNAFCIPGGKIAVFTGILDKLQMTDDEIALVLGHEISHALREHSRARMAKAELTNWTVTAVSLLLGQTAGAIGQGVGGLFNLKFSRNDETEADLIGMELAARAGYNPESGIALWRKMSAVSQGQPWQWLSDHPANATRIETIRKHLPEVMPLYYEATKKQGGCCLLAAGRRSGRLAAFCSLGKVS